MSLRPSWRPDLSKESVPEDRPPEAPATRSDPAQKVAELTVRLAKAGGGALSADLALDLILNEMVEQARRDTRGSGAAIALARGGEMICRATAGNAPELGTPVDTSSGLSAACLKTGATQECSDTECDPRVDRDACRDLHIRSTLLVPIVQDGTACGILEVFSSVPNNFVRDDLETLGSLTNKIVNAKKAAESGVRKERSSSELKIPLAETTPSVTADARAANSAMSPLAPGSESQVKNEVLSVALVVLVVAAAILLGLVIGVRQMAKHTAVAPSAQLPRNTTAIRPSPPPSSPAPAPNTPPAKDSVRISASPPAGGLIVTQNGKVIYQAEPPAMGGSPQNVRDRNVLLQYVNPQYPEAAKSQHIQGTVVLEAKVLDDGTVADVDVVEGDPLLAEAAKTAVRRWKYKPSGVASQPVQRIERITVKFALRPS